VINVSRSHSKKMKRVTFLDHVYVRPIYYSSQVVYLSHLGL